MHQEKRKEEKLCREPAAGTVSRFPKQNIHLLRRKARNIFPEYAKVESVWFKDFARDPEIFIDDEKGKVEHAQENYLILISPNVITTIGS